MAKYKLSNIAKEDLVRIHQYGMIKFGASQADKYIDALFNQFEIIAARPYSFESVDHIRAGYRRSVCGVDSIFFRINNKVIEIMMIIGRQNIDQIFK
ncbi:type II toxin-antitoxin system RelE/ParE family toxin [Croceimicrobium hydrocarbonivorans]|uniref:Type II toxin-antitoxin system RelE/ParE family toxin n=1 Tax=Croceimicrobium hydrocarbonivorans TaxID=2761580 RepID=A0A7H0VC56_9FLAO|nr:type II toxin-antitoxin system RelE/ParE family toxin [Croceimicrobium hydrocarbonivorans]QNR23304.1 type II toxin-antitoxin system RelE/ParE family toxin [Croceimicrobium hydrocarbonivorans]